MAKPKTGIPYSDLFDIASDPANKVEMFDNGTALITLPNYVQGIWVSAPVVAAWKAAHEAEQKAENKS